MCEEFGLIFGYLGELALEAFRNAGVQRTSRLTQERPVSCVLYKCVLKQIGRMWAHSLPEQQTCLDETIKRLLKFRVRFACDGSQQTVRELPSNHSSNLCNLLRRTEPI
jgi:hypothetical protein